jgi:hypothetical protein
MASRTPLPKNMVGQPADTAASAKKATAAMFSDSSKFNANELPETAQIEQAQFDYLRSAYEDQAAVISGAMDTISGYSLVGGGLVDADALTSILQDSFNKTANQIINTATASNRKSLMELDSYLGSTSSDARSSVRFRLANETTNNILGSMYGAIDNAYSNFSKSVVDTALRAAEINSPFIIQQTSQLASLGQSSVDLYNAMATATNNAYMANVNASLGWINANLTAYQSDLQMQATRETLGLEYAKLAETARQFDWKEQKEAAIRADSFKAVGAPFIPSI